MSNNDIEGVEQFKTNLIFYMGNDVIQELDQIIYKVYYWRATSYAEIKFITLDRPNYRYYPTYYLLRENKVFQRNFYESFTNYEIEIPYDQFIKEIKELARYVEDDDEISLEDTS